MTLQYAGSKNKAINNELLALEKKLKTVEEQLNLQTIFTDSHEQYVNIQKDISKIMAYKTQGAKIRCRTDWTELGEKPTGYFLNKEKSNFNRTVINTLIANGVRITHQLRILKEEQIFFEELYKSRMEELAPDPDYLNDPNIPRITEVQRLSLDDPIVIEEIIEAIKFLKSGKVVGVDWLPIEICKRFSCKLAPVLLEVFREAILDKKLHLSARRGVISLPKKIGRNPLYLNNWRPLTLLNVDYKLFSKVIAMRLNTVMSDIIDPMQSGFMKNRSTVDSICKLTNLNNL